MDSKRGYGGIESLPEDVTVTHEDEVDLGEVEPKGATPELRRWSAGQDSDYRSVAGNARTSTLQEDDLHGEYEPYVPSTSPFNESEYAGVAGYCASPSLHHIPTDYGDGYSTEGSRLTRW